jgi:hypothetical protein
MRPNIITASPDMREARETFEFFDRLSSSPRRNANSIIALAEKLISLPVVSQNVDQELLSLDTANSGHVATESNAQSTPRRKRGRPMKIPEELKRRALSAQGNKARAQIIYQTPHPTSKQKKNVSAILGHYVRTHPASGS